MTEKHNTWFGQIRYLVFVKIDEYYGSASFLCPDSDDFQFRDDDMYHYSNIEYAYRLCNSKENLPTRIKQWCEDRGFNIMYSIVTHELTED